MSSLEGLTVFFSRSTAALLLIGVVVAPIPVVAGTGRVIHARRPVAGQYIVVLENVGPSEVEATAQRLVRSYGGSVRRTMKDAAQAFSANMTSAQADALAFDLSVKVVEENGYVELSSYQSVPDADQWNLDRIDQAGPTRDYKYYYCEKASSVTAYVVDTGIMKTHSEFQTNGVTRVKNGVAFSNDFYPAPGETTDYGTNPCGGFTYSYGGSHGTAVASVLGGNTSGVAKAVKLVPVKVLDCNATGTLEQLCWGLDWIRSSANPYRFDRPAVINMSTYFYLGDYDPTPVSSMESVIQGLVLDGTTPDGADWKGITVVVSANNQGQATDASHPAQTSPARLAYTNASLFPASGRVISVGGTQENDARWVCTPVSTCPTDHGFPIASNYGYATDIYAPANNIKTAYTCSNYCWRTDYKSGTSFAAPTAAGIIARILQVQPTLTPSEVWQKLKADAALAAAPIDTVTGNKMIVKRSGAMTCSPEYP